MNPSSRRLLVRSLSAGMLATVTASAQVPPVPDGHPRVYVRDADLPAVAAKLKDPDFADAWEAVQESDTPLALAFRYLVEGDTAAGQQAITQGLAELEACDDARVFDQAMHWGACVYDWCYPLLTSAQKQAFIDEFERIAASHDPGYPADPQSPAVVGHVTEGWLLSGQLPAGVAIYDESTTMYDAAAALFVDRFVPVRDFYYPAHMHHQGDSYISRFAHDQAVSWLFRRMGAGDVLSIEQATVPYQLLYHLRPDGQQMRSGDTYDDSGRSSAKRLIAMLTGSYYQDPHLLWLADTSLFWSYPSYHRVLELLFRPAGLASTSPDSLPKSKFFPMPMGEMVARTGFSVDTASDDTVIHMRIGGSFFGNHQRKDWGIFQIYHRGPLAISSGVYEGDNSLYGSDHWRNYHHQTISQNGLLIFDPSEPMTKGSGSTANDGGQRWPTGTDHPRDVGALTSDDYEFGRVTSRAIGPDPTAPKYSYLAGDITNAYGNGKVSKVTRAMVALTTGEADVPMTMVVFDRVIATDPAFKKTWLLHSIQEPAVDGSRITILRDGPTWNDTGTYDGKLVADSLLPPNASIAKVGGPGKEFWVESTQTNYAVTKGGAAEPGAWRVEVSPSASAAHDQFLHVMRVMSSGQAAPAPAQSIEGDGLVGGVGGGWGALFSASGELLDSGTFSWTGTEDVHLLVCDLVEGWWTVSRNGEVVGVREVLAEENALFVEGPAGDYALEPGAPPDAGGSPDGGVLPDGAVVPDASDDSGMGADGAPAGEGGVAGAAGSASTNPDGEDEDGGCGCRTDPSRSTSWGILSLALAALGLRRRRSP